MDSLYIKANHYRLKLVSLFLKKQKGNKLELMEIQAYIKKSVDIINAIQSGIVIDYEKDLGEIEDFINNQSTKNISIKQK